MLKTMGILFASGAILGTLGDFVHVITQTDGYPPGGVFLPWLGQPFWVPLLFGSAGLSIGLSHLQADRWILQRPVPQKSLPAILSAGGVFLALYSASGVLPLPTGSGMDLVLALGCMTLWWVFDRTLWNLALGIATALIGVGVEIGLTQMGAFFYYPHAANFMGVPSWLPWLYISASLAVGHFARHMREMQLYSRPSPVRGGS